VGLFWYDRRNDTRNLKIDVYSAFSTDRGSHWGPLGRVTSTNFGTPQMYPRYDTTNSNCHWGGSIAVAAPGSGFYVAWVDNRDRGPTANRGSDQNIYFAHAIVPTTLTSVVAKTSSKANVTGKLAPVVAGARVVVTLFRRNTAGVYARITGATRTVTSAGAYSASFNRQRAGSCKVTAAYAGNAEYGASSKSITFTC